MNAPRIDERPNRWSGVASAVVVAAALVPALALAQTEQRILVTEAKLTLTSFVNDPDMNWLQRNLGRAKAVLIAPNIAKAGFIVGGSGGRAVAIAHDSKTGKWVGPAFYTLATASVGLQAGFSVSEMVALVMTDKGLNTMLADSFRMGGDVAIAAGPVGGGAQSNLAVDLVSFSRSQGVYAGLNFDGTIVSTADDWNRAYYGQTANPVDILVRMSVQNRQADELLNIVAAAAKK